MADYTPTLGDYTELKPFRFWCQKVLPLVYDDSLSYYELLCKVVDYLNKTMEDVDTMHDDVVNLHSAYVQLQTYVNTYFDNLDVQEEIDNKLDAMAQDGSLSALISPFIPDIVAAWLADHITPTTPAIDNTLTVSGAGADAKTVGDNAILSSRVNNVGILTDSVLTSMNVTKITELPVNRIYTLTDVSVLTDGPTDVISPPYYGFLMIAKHSANAWPCVIFVTNAGLTFTGTIAGNTTMRWDTTIARVNNLYSTVMTSSQFIDIPILTDTELNSRNITSITQLPVNRIYSLTDVSVITDGPTEVVSPPYNGFLMIAKHSNSAWPGVIFVTNAGRTFTGTYTGNTMRWDTTVLKQVEHLESNVLASSQLDDIPILTDTVLTSRGITSITQLPVNRIYSLTDVSVITDGPTEVISPPYYGFLMIAKHSNNAWAGVMFVNNAGRTFTGTYTGNTMRWDYTVVRNYAKTVMSSDIDNIPILTDSVLNGRSITSVTQLPVNRIYSLTAVSVLTDMPNYTGDKYYGSLMITKHSTNAWACVIFVNNAGKTFTGTYTGNSMRWDVKYADVNTLLFGIYNKNVTLVGDSIMYGSHMSDAGTGDREVITIRGTTIYNNTSTKVWSKLFADYLNSVYNCTVLNQSFPGCSFGDVANNLSTLIPSTSDYAIILLGVNDWGAPSSVYAKCETIINYCYTNNIIPVFLTPYIAKEYIKQLAEIRGAIKRLGTNVSDFYSTFNLIIYTMGVDIDTIFDDNIHYNDAGQPYIFEAVKKSLNL